jgi:hypothetical protein
LVLACFEKEESDRDDFVSKKDYFVLSSPEEGEKRPYCGQERESAEKQGERGRETFFILGFAL